MNTQATPRPWDLDACFEDKHPYGGSHTTIETGEYIVFGGDRTFRDVDGGEITDEGEVCTTDKANAELIVKAVNSREELLEIAKKLVALCSSAEGLGGHAPMFGFNLLADKARSVIVKIEEGK